MNRTSAINLAVRFGALVAIGFYVGTAHLTRGHEADFGKQWLAARLVATGQGKCLFDLDVQRAELEKHFDREVIDHGIWREGIGGPTYPPTLGVGFSPLGWLAPRWAQWVLVEISVLAVLLAAWQLSRTAARGVTWELCVLATLSFPGFFLAMGVGQNSALSLAVFVAGWTLLARDREFAAGAVWGLFAIKPTWGLAVAWLPAAVGRPRAYLGMVCSSLALVVLTLPFCGLDAWFDWLTVARSTEHFYQTLPRWTDLSRDLPGLLRRIDQGNAVEIAGWATVLLVLFVTTWMWRRQRLTRIHHAASAGTAMLLAGAILTCPRFMFYDMTLAVVPFLIALGGWRDMTTKSRWVFGFLCGLLWIGTAYCYLNWTMVGPPLDTLALLGLWVWSISQQQFSKIYGLTDRDESSHGIEHEPEFVAATF